MAILAIIVLVLVMVALLAYVGTRDAHAAAWLPRALPQAGRADVGGGPFRAARVGAVSWRWTRGGVPWPIAISAVTSYGFGQMLVPGVLLAMGGLLFIADEGARAWALGVLALTAVPGAYVAAQVWRCADAMLSNQIGRGYAQINRALRATVAHNVPLLVFALAVIAAEVRGYEVFYATLFYATCSLAHVFALRAVWRAHARRVDALESAAAEVHALGLDPMPMAS